MARASIKIWLSLALVPAMLLSAAAAPAGGKLAFKGGPVLPNVKVLVVFWGANVADQPKLGPFYQAITNSAYYDWLAEYDTASPAQVIGRGSFLGELVDTQASSSTTLQDSDVQAELDRLVTAGKLLPDENTYFAVHFPPGVTISWQGETVAYHFAFKSAKGPRVSYGVIPAVGQFDDQTLLASHELAEATTDPDPDVPAWIDQQGYEIGDPCYPMPGTAAGYVVQLLWSNSQNACVDHVASAGVDAAAPPSEPSVSDLGAWGPPATGPGDGGSPPSSARSTGCGCSLATAPTSRGGTALLLLLLGPYCLALRRRAYVLAIAASLWARDAQAKDVEIVAVMWQQDLSVQSEVTQFFGCLTTSSTFGTTWAQEFGLTKVTFKGVYVLSDPCPQDAHLGGNLETLLDTAFDQGKLPIPSPGFSTSYLLYLPSGVQGYDPSGIPACQGTYCGVHGPTTYKGLQFDAAIVPIQCSDCGAVQVTLIGEHEAAEAIANMGTAQYEVGDSCEGPSNETQLDCCGTQYPIQQLSSSQAASDCQTITATPGGICQVPPAPDAAAIADAGAGEGMDAGSGRASDGGSSGGAANDAAMGGAASDAASGGSVGPSHPAARPDSQAGCGCSTHGNRGAGGVGALAAMLVLATLLRRRRAPFLLLLIPLFALGCGSAESNDAPDAAIDLAAPGPGDDPRVKALLAFAQSELASSGTPGVGIALVLDGKLALATGVGVKRQGGSDPITDQTRFRVGSMTKMITAAALMTELEQGKLDLGHRLSEYLPELALAAPFDPATISPEQLLTHTAGLPDDYSDMCATGPGSLAQYFAAHHYPLWAPPGAVWDYSNVGFAITGWLVEKLAGRQYEDAVAARVLTPAGMSLATFDPALAAAGDHAVGHEIDPMSGTTYFVEPGDYDCAFLRPPGGLFAAASDYARFAEALLADGAGVLSADSANRMRQPHADTHSGTPEDAHYGYGLLIGQYKGQRMVWHDGSMPGFISVVILIPERNFAAVAFSNLDSYHPLPIALRAADLFLDLPSSKDPDPTTSPSTWGVYVGSYYDPYHYGHVDVTLSDGGVLSAQLAARTLPLTQYAGDDFILYELSPTTPTDVVFWRNDGGEAQYFVSRDGIGARVDGGSPPDGGGGHARPWPGTRLEELRRSALRRWR